MFNSLNVLHCCDLLFVLGCAAALIPIPPRVCPKHETFFACGPSCQTLCATLGEPCLIRYFHCPVGCYCDKGFARDDFGTCIPIGQCRPKRPKHVSNKGPVNEDY